VAIALGYALKDEDDQVRASGAQGLQMIAAAAAPVVPQLINGLKDRVDSVRWNCAIVLGRIGSAAQDAVPALTAALNDPNQTVRTQAQRALTLINKK
jgi:HEAT repeat protein